MSLEKNIHLSSLDEFLAESFLENENNPIKLAMSKSGEQGYVSLHLSQAQEEIDGEGIDFELSPCECLDLEMMEVSDYLGKPIYTSSAYEFFAFLLMFYDKIECLANFSGNAWKIKILSIEKA